MKCIFKNCYSGTWWVVSFYQVWNLWSVNPDSSAQNLLRGQRSGVRGQGSGSGTEQPPHVFTQWSPSSVHAGWVTCACACACACACVCVCVDQWRNTWTNISVINLKLHLCDVIFTVREEAGFVTNTAASHQRAIKMIWLHFWGPVMSSMSKVKSDTAGGQSEMLRPRLLPPFPFLPG